MSRLDSPRLPEGTDLHGDMILPAIPPGAADLPRALCRVLLAAHRVAMLEAP